MRRQPQVPRAYIAHLCGLGLAGLELRRFLRASARPWRRAFRINLRKGEPELWSKLPGATEWSVSPVPWCADGFEVEEAPPSGSLGNSRQNATGQIYVQSSSSMLPVEILRRAVNAGGRVAATGALQVLDLCAAPGSKATQLAEWLDARGNGLLVANERNSSRTSLLRATLLKAGMMNCLTTGLDGRSMGKLAPRAFDAVLVDAPCSCEASIRRGEQVLRYWLNPGHRDDLLELAGLQLALLRSAWAALRPGGHLVYSTCTLNRLENEEVCRHFLDACAGSVRTVHIGKELDFLHSVTSEGFLRLWPHHFDSEGFFVACFEKKPDEEAVASRSATVARGTTEETTLWPKLQPLGEQTTVELQALAQEELGFCLERRDGAFVQDEEGQIWRLPRIPSDLAACARSAQEPGVRIARHAADGKLELSDELVLVAGEPNGPRLNLGGWVSLLCRVRQSDVTSYNAELAFYASRGDLTRARSILAEMQRKRLEPDRISYGTLVKAHGQHGDVEGARRIFDGLHTARLKPDLMIFSQLIKAYAVSSDISGAEDVLSDLLGQRLRPDMRVYNPLLNACAKVGNMGDAERIFAGARRQGAKEDVPSLSTLMKGYEIAGDLPKTREVYERLCAGFQPSVTSYNTMLRALVHHGDGSHGHEVGKVLQEMQQRRVQSNGTTQHLIALQGRK